MDGRVTQAEATLSAAELRRIRPLSVVQNQPSPTGWYVDAVKPLSDLIIGVLSLILLLPLLAICALAVRITLGKQVLFKQARIGRNGRAFTMYKFRTMRPDRRVHIDLTVPYAGPERRMTHKHRDDPRHTALGRVMRKFSLDELPQVFNVLKGDMSIVGPRPQLVALVEQFDPWEHDRHLVRPGLTGLWQISERGTTPMEECSHYDIEYIRTVSAWLDLKIMLLTPFAVLWSRQGE